VFPQLPDLPIHHHHDPVSAPDPYQELANILQIAGRLSAIYHDQNSGEKVHQLQTDLEERYDLSGEQTLRLADSIADQSIEILTAFEINPGDLKPYSMMLQEANEELGRLNLSYELTGHGPQECQGRDSAPGLRVA